MALSARTRPGMAAMAGAVVHHFQSYGGKGRGEFFVDGFGHGAHRCSPFNSSVSILESQRFQRILRTMSGAFQYRPKFVDIRVRPPKPGEEDAADDVNALKPGERACDHPGCRLAASARAPKSRQMIDEHYWFC